MGRHYTQLSLEDRRERARLHAQGRSLRQIATSLARAPATIARELNRNTSRPRYAQEPAHARLRGPLPAPWRQTVTFDNGTEFARHHEFHALGLETFCCDTHAPWQNGGAENASGRQRRGLPRKTALATGSGTRFTEMVPLYNNTPARVWTTSRPRKSSGTTWCASNVNPPSRLGRPLHNAPVR